MPWLVEYLVRVAIEHLHHRSDIMHFSSQLVRATLPKIQTGPLVRRWMDENIEHPRMIFPKEYGIPLERDRIPVRVFAPYYPELHTRQRKKHAKRN